MTERSLCSIVVPWNSVAVQESKHGVFVSLESLVVPTEELLTDRPAVDDVTIKAIHAGFVLLQVPRLQSKSLDVLKNRNEQITHQGYKFLVFFVEGVFPKVIVHVPD